MRDHPEKLPLLNEESLAIRLVPSITNNSDYPLLPGQSHIYLDSAFVADASIQGVAPGEEFWSNLGIDEGIAFERKRINKFEETVGFLGAKKRITYEYVTRVVNNKKSREEIVLWDQLPLAGTEEIKVKLLEPDYSEDSDTLKKNEFDFFEWFRELNPGEEEEISFSYSVEFDKELNISGLE